jgi:hypothetical protein
MFVSTVALKEKAGSQWMNKQEGADLEDLPLQAR